MNSNLELLQKLLLKKAVFVDDETFNKASLTSDQARTIKRYSSYTWKNCELNKKKFPSKRAKLKF
ncbi:hypothetical protein QQ045_032794 [Rhodiola kirilowii]